MPGDNQTTERAVITLATTKQVFVDMAFALARSFLRWNRGSGIAFHLITDLDFPLPPDLAEIHVVKVEHGSLGAGFSPKLHLDYLAPAKQTMFIDADCLCMGPLAPVFDKMAGRKVSVTGHTIATGLWFGNVDALCARFGVSALPKFNGGLYYIEPGPEATAVYKRARELEPQYDEIGLIRLRGRPNDELLLSIAMAEADMWPLTDDDSEILAGLNVFPKHEVDVLSGRCRLENPPPPDPRHKPAMPIKVTHALIPHFTGSYADQWRYRAEAEKLRLTSQNRLPDFLARLVTGLRVALPGWSIETAKDVLRPLYHKLFGARAIMPSSRE